jgi:hypothetical protein
MRDLKTFLPTMRPSSLNGIFWSGPKPTDKRRTLSPSCDRARGECDSLCNVADAAWLLSSLTSAPGKQDIKLANGTHLMHLEQGRGKLDQAAHEQR